MGEDKYRLTTAAIVQCVLKDYGIDINTRLAGHIWEDILDLLQKQGYIE